MHLSRRHFLRASAAFGAGFLGLRELLGQERSARAPGYGELVPDPARILDLPPGFSYRILSRTGETMDDGFRVPAAHDGMAAFPGPDGLTILVRNHEIKPPSRHGPFGERAELFPRIDRAKVYDPAGPGPGGTTTLVYDTRERRLVRHFLSLAGTWRNCAGGPTPWGSWITCEETTERAGSKGAGRDHGYVFEVPAAAEPRLADPVPIRAMGRFNHEAVAVDPRSGAVYETEDRSDGLLYRYLPEEPGRLARGGRLQALKVKDKPGLTTRNDGKGPSVPVGAPLEVEWVDLEDVESPGDDLRRQGFARGAAAFSRGEGIWYGRGAVYFACTSGGRNKKGQIWRYVPSPEEGRPGEARAPGRLELFVEPNDDTLLENGDNLTVAPWGDLVVCENAKKEQHVVGVTPEGRFYNLARNPRGDSEFAGACFSPDGSTLFVNIQKAGLTVAIAGPWRGA
jgi:secreted PhoX family phosphatase